MGRKSALTEKQWAEIQKRLLDGEAGRVLAREFNISEAAIRKRLGAQCAQIKTVANQVVAADAAFKSLPIGAQNFAASLIDELKAISTHLAGAARYGAATSHRLAGIANTQVEKIDSVNPMESQEVLQGISALTKMSNEASVIGIGLLAANKDMVKEHNAGGNQSNAEILKELVKSLPL